MRREGRSWSHPLLVLIACPNQLEQTRVGITAGKSVGGAVVRNRAKRRLRETVRLAASQLAIGWDVVLIARPNLAKADWDAVIEAVSQLIARAKLRKVG